MRMFPSYSSQLGHNNK